MLSSRAMVSPQSCLDRGDHRFLMHVVRYTVSRASVRNRGGCSSSQSKTDRSEVPAEVAQSVEQWSEESRRARFAKLLGNLRLIPEIRLTTPWCMRPIILKCGGQAALHVSGRTVKRRMGSATCRAIA